MTEFAQELLTPDEAATWFRRSATWLRNVDDLVVFSAGQFGAGGQTLYPLACLRAFVLGWTEGLRGAALRRRQIEALAGACGLAAETTTKATKEHEGQTEVSSPS